MLCAFEESMGMSQESVSEKMPEGYTLCEFMTVNAMISTGSEFGQYIGCRVPISFYMMKFQTFKFIF